MFLIVCILTGVKGYPLVALICIPLMISDVVGTFSYTFWNLGVFLLRNVDLNPCPLQNQIVFFFRSSGRSFLCVLDNEAFIRYVVCKCFLPLLKLPLHSVELSFTVLKFSCLFCFCFLGFHVIPKKSLPRFKLKSFLLTFLLGV